MDAAPPARAADRNFGDRLAEGHCFGAEDLKEPRRATKAKDEKKWQN
jgi:hypothetical protein